MIIARTVFQRPAFLKLSLEYQEKMMMHDKCITVFFVDVDKNGSADEESLRVIEQFNYPKRVVVRDNNYGVSYNAADGLKYCFDNFDTDWVLFLEEDVLPCYDSLKIVYTFNKYPIVSDILGVSLGCKGFIADKKDQLIHIDNMFKDIDPYKSNFGSHFTMMNRLFAVFRHSFDKYIREYICNEYRLNKIDYTYKKFPKYANGECELDQVFGFISLEHEVPSLYSFIPRYGDISIYSTRIFLGSSDFEQIPIDDQYELLKSIALNPKEMNELFYKLYGKCHLYSSWEEKRVGIFHYFDPNIDFGNVIILDNNKFYYELEGNK